MSKLQGYVLLHFYNKLFHPIILGMADIASMNTLFVNALVY